MIFLVVVAVGGGGGGGIFTAVLAGGSVFLHPSKVLSYLGPSQSLQMPSQTVYVWRREAHNIC